MKRLSIFRIEPIVEIIAVLFAAFALVLAIVAYHRHPSHSTTIIAPTVKKESGAGYGQTGCLYLEGVGASQGAPVSRCVLKAVHTKGDAAVGLFNIKQKQQGKMYSYNLVVAFVKSQWQVVTAWQPKTKK